MKKLIFFCAFTVILLGFNLNSFAQVPQYHINNSTNATQNVHLSFSSYCWGAGSWSGAVPAMTSWLFTPPAIISGTFEVEAATTSPDCLPHSAAYDSPAACGYNSAHYKGTAQCIEDYEIEIFNYNHPLNPSGITINIY